MEFINRNNLNYSTVPSSSSSTTTTRVLTTTEEEASETIPMSTTTTNAPLLISRFLLLILHSSGSQIPLQTLLKVLVLFFLQLKIHDYKILLKKIIKYYPETFQ